MNLTWIPWADGHRLMDGTHDTFWRVYPSSTVFWMVYLKQPLAKVYQYFEVADEARAYAETTYTLQEANRVS